MACLRQLLLGYLPPETGVWAAALAQKRAAYAQFCAELIVDPKGGGAAAAAAPDDHPLSQSDGSKWHAYFKARHAPGLRGRVCDRIASGPPAANCGRDARQHAGHYSRALCPPGGRSDGVCAHAGGLQALHSPARPLRPR